jgi:hypothetical protein
VLTLKKLENNPGTFEELGQEFARNEMQILGRTVHSPNTFYMPEPWLEAMKAIPQLVGLASKFKPLYPENLAPMSDRMKELCSILGLPYYTTPLDGIKELERQTLIEAYTKDPPITIKRRRCTLCGDWRESSTCCGSTEDGN